jgi:hypothetical protein
MYLKISSYLKKTYNKLEHINNLLLQKSLYFELLYYIGKKEIYLKPIDYYKDGFGKTKTLLELANKFDIPVVLSSKQQMLYVRNYNKKINNKEVKLFVPDDLRGHKFSTVLVDEGVLESDIRKYIMPITENIVGFRKNY